MAKAMGRTAQIAKELGGEGGSSPRPRPFERREWEVQEDGQLVNTQTGELRETLDGPDTESVEDDQSGGFDEYSQVPPPRGYEERGHVPNRVEKLPLPGAWRGAGKARPERSPTGKRR